MKKCTKCKVDKPLIDFSKDKYRKDGLESRCKVCKKTSSRDHYQNNKEYYKEYGRENKQKIKDYYQNNKDAFRVAQSRWQKNNKDKGNAKQAKRRATKLQATPQWADLGKIQEVYKEAQRLTELLGIEMHVDHIVPLQGTLVSGLHVETNLQILTAVENLRKSNKFEVIL